MNGGASPPAQVPGLVANIGRSRIELALVDQHGRLRRDTIRAYTSAEEAMISGAIIRFAHEASVAAPYDVSLAVAGVVRGDSVRITNSPWIVSRSGLTAMLQRSPVLINDFAAKAWALAGDHGVSVRSLGATATSGPTGTHCLVGVGDELGVGAFVIGEGGRPTVLASEGGASGLPYGALSAAMALKTIRSPQERVQADAILSSSGLMSIYTGLCAAGGHTPRWKDGIAVGRAASSQGGDPAATAAVRQLCDALLAFASDLVLIYGAWDGLYLAGAVVEAITRHLQDAIRAGGLALRGPHARRLSQLPVSLVTFEHGELSGAAIALRAHRLQ